MAVQRISPTEAKQRQDEGYTLLDVRSLPEYEQGHPTGAYNAPLLHAGPGGMAPNPEFVAVVSRAFPKDTRLVVSCKAGGRSQRAAMMLEAAGFTNLLEMRGGYSGEMTPTGGLEPGWEAKGLPISTTPTPGGTWAELKAK